MHILMIDQHFSMTGEGFHKRFYEIGCRMVKQGYQVTVISGNAGLEFPLEKKKMGLLQQDGMAVVVFNLDGKKKRGGGMRESCRRASAFARFTGRQGRKLPRPDLLLAATPPLITLKPALALSRHYRAPLILDIREAEPILQQPKRGWRSLLDNCFTRRLLFAAYRCSRALIVTGAETAALIKENVPDHGEMVVVPENAGGDIIFERFVELQGEKFSY